MLRLFYLSRYKIGALNSFNGQIKSERFGNNTNNSTLQIYAQAYRIKNICCQLGLKRGLENERLGLIDEPHRRTVIGLKLIEIFWI